MAAQPTALVEPARLQKCVGDRGDQGVAVQDFPGTFVEMVEPKFFLPLLVHLLADPMRFDGAGGSPDRRTDGQV
jgi:hypothetical protein